MHQQRCVGSVGDGIVAEQYYDLEAAANAHSWCVRLALASESEVRGGGKEGQTLYNDTTEVANDAPTATCGRRSSLSDV